VDLGIGQRFGDDTLGYFTERLSPERTRQEAVSVLKRAKRNKAFDDCRYIKLAIDGTGADHSRKARCRLCRPVRDDKGSVHRYGHHLSMISVVGTGLTLPFDVEPYGPGDCEYNPLSACCIARSNSLDPALPTTSSVTASTPLRPSCTWPVKSA